MLSNATLIFAIILGIGFLCQWLAWRTKLPAILFLLISGIALGPLAGWLNPDALFEDLLFPFISMSVAIILFEGALTLKITELKELGKVVQKLVSIGALATWCCVAIATYLLFDLSVGVAILFGAIMVVTGPTVIVPLLRTVRPTRKIGKILRWEGIVIDPIGALLAVVVFEFLTSIQGGHAVQHSALLFITVLLAGGGIGVFSGFILGLLLRKRWIPEYLQNLATLSFVLGAFAVSNNLAHESGLLAATVMGMWLANVKGIHTEEILNFKENLSVLLISGLFIVLAARININDILDVGVQALLLLVIIQAVARPLCVALSTLKSDLTWRERALLAWVAPRGIVAAAVSAIFAIELEKKNIAGHELLVPLTFTVIIGTVVLQSLTAKWLARWLKVAESAPRGFLIVGANPVAQKIGKSIQDLGFDVLLCDANWRYIKESRMKGLNCFYGNPVSEYADQKLDLVGLGKLLALSSFSELNAIAATRYKNEFGKANVFTLLSENDTQSSDKHRLSSTHHGNILFNRYLTYSKLAQLFSEGREIRGTKLTEEFNFSQYMEHNNHKLIPLFAITQKGRIEMFFEEGGVHPKPGWTIFSINFE